MSIGQEVDCPEVLPVKLLRNQWILGACVHTLCSPHPTQGTVSPFLQHHMRSTSFVSPPATGTADVSASVPVIYVWRYLTVAFFWHFSQCQIILPFHVLICHLHSLFCEMSLHVIWPFSIRLFDFYCSVLRLHYIF